MMKNKIFYLLFFILLNNYLFAKNIIPDTNSVLFNMKKNCKLKNKILICKNDNIILSNKIKIKTAYGILQPIKKEKVIYKKIVLKNINYKKSYIKKITIKQNKKNLTFFAKSFYIDLFKIKFDNFNGIIKNKDNLITLNIKGYIKNKLIFLLESKILLIGKDAIIKNIKFNLNNIIANKKDLKELKNFIKKLKKILI